MSNEMNDKRRSDIDDIIDLLQPVRVYPVTDPAVILANDTDDDEFPGSADPDDVEQPVFDDDDDSFGDYPNIEEYVHDAVMINGYDWYDQSDWKDDDSITSAQKDELFDWLEERDISVEVTIRLRHPEA